MSHPTPSPHRRPVSASVLGRAPAGLLRSSHPKPDSRQANHFDNPFNFAKICCIFQPSGNFAWPGFITRSRVRLYGRMVALCPRLRLKTAAPFSGRLWTSGHQQRGYKPMSPIIDPDSQLSSQLKKALDNWEKAQDNLMKASQEARNALYIEIYNLKSSIKKK